VTRDELREAVKQATKIVESWPLWKQNILKHSGEPSVSVPRTPVDNSQPDHAWTPTGCKARKLAKEFSGE
jgi:hypothetical protein